MGNIVLLDSFQNAAAGLFVAFLTLRLFQRLYYVLKGHSHHFSYSPRKELEIFIKEKNIQVSSHSLISTQDGTTNLTYRRLGSGTKYILLANGVATDFFMCLPMLKFLVKFDPTFFNKFTLIVQSYRGLFAPMTEADNQEHSHTNSHSSSTAKQAKTGIDISVLNCVEDVRDMMNHASKFIMMIYAFYWCIVV